MKKSEEALAVEQAEGLPEPDPLTPAERELREHIERLRALAVQTNARALAAGERLGINGAHLELSGIERALDTFARKRNSEMVAGGRGRLDAFDRRRGAEMTRLETRYDTLTAALRNAGEDDTLAALRAEQEALSAALDAMVGAYFDAQTGALLAEAEALQSRVSAALGLAQALARLSPQRRNENGQPLGVRRADEGILQRQRAVLTMLLGRARRYSVEAGLAQTATEQRLGELLAPFVFVQPGEYEPGMGRTP
jgi:hypothetical protein